MSVCKSVIVGSVLMAALPSVAFVDSWTQWGQDSQHWGFAPVVGQPPLRILADIIYDPFSAQEQAEAGGSLLTHFQAPLGGAKLWSGNLLRVMERFRTSLKAQTAGRCR